ncbi:T9SS type A sorting domain-containing protein [Aureibaculum sp. 2210JD6-5]|uniref:T9SS type A sorting domain-containing protein n=1 Tax=Aureibaculum sp. 2210JD6-5 TaxID=3103957 RepID=UPI002AAEF9DE|nr:T9SS type A sorting domain-containing protein [Aureibaculum sp. 2210JD6-5]MDY7395491.1 T9SS type A sorting domain-containing protein [Aureibaculum sp. 2210JD6-5]
MMNRKTTYVFLIAFFFLFTGLLQANENEADATAPPVNDDCVNATTLTVNTNYLCNNVSSGTLVDATASTVSSDGAIGSCPSVSTKANDDVWFKFVATNVSHRVKILNITGSITDLYTNVYNGGVSGSCPTTATPLYCSDPETINLSSLTIGNTYFIRIYSNSTASGATTTFDVCVGSQPVTPANDDCSSAEVILSLPHNATYDATAATNNSGFITATGCLNMNDGVWFEIVGDGGTISITASPTSWDLGIAVYTGSCGTLICEGSANNGTMNVVEGVSFASASGTTYYINVAYPSGGLDNPEGVFDLAVTSSTLSIDKILDKGFTYYPNPVEKTLKMRANENIQQINLYSVLGKEIMRVNQNDIQAELKLDNLPSGTYFVKAFVGGSSGTFKILKK